MDARGLIGEVLRRDVEFPSADLPLAELDGWDSLKAVRLLVRLEEILGSELSEENIASIQSVGDVDRILKSGS